MARKKLTGANKAKPAGHSLTSHTSTPFIVSFKYRLEKDYGFDSLQIKHLRQFQDFLNRVSQMTFLEVDRIYRRKPDKSDIFQGKDVIHYNAGGSFRIHGVLEEGRFKVIRLDPEHRYHS